MKQGKIIIMSYSPLSSTKAYAHRASRAGDLTILHRADQCGGGWRMEAKDDFRYCSPLMLVTGGNRTLWHQS